MVISFYPRNFRGFFFVLMWDHIASVFLGWNFDFLVYKCLFFNGIIW